MMTDYKHVFRSLTGISGHIEPTPRWDLGKVFVFTKDFPADQLRGDLERRIGVRPKISEVEAIRSVLYVLPTEIPQGVSAEIRNMVAQESLAASAVFIRGATNPCCISGARNEAGKLCLEH